ncbi:MAG: N-formylglutamate amidohydrolase [Planctomycetota bacterium]
MIGPAPVPIGVVVTCEHAAAAIPAELGDLGLGPEVLASHRAWDPGAAGIAKVLAKAMGAPLHLGQWSRLVVDLNRSQDRAGAIPRRLDRRDVPGNQIDAGARTWRLAKYWSPWRRAAEADIARAAANGVALHLSVHSFTPQLNGVVRENDIGLLHDPDRSWEVTFCDAMKPLLASHGLSARRNFPYFGNTDGLTSHLRRVLPPNHYVGIEIECNQRLVAGQAGERRVARALGAALTTIVPR